jgi:hypothetical protein
MLILTAQCLFQLSTSTNWPETVAQSLPRDLTVVRARDPTTIRMEKRAYLPLWKTLVVVPQKGDCGPTMGILLGPQSEIDREDCLYNSWLIPK